MNGGRERGKFWRKFGGPEGEREPSARGARGIRSLSLGSSPGFIVENTARRGLHEPTNPTDVLGSGWWAAEDERGLEARLKL